MSPLPVTVPPPPISGVDSTSMTIEIPASTPIARKFVLISSPEYHPLVADLVLGLNTGMPLDRPAELLSLAEEVMSRPAGYPADWAAVLTADFARLDD